MHTRKILTAALSCLFILLSSTNLFAQDDVRQGGTTLYEVPPRWLADLPTAGTLPRRYFNMGVRIEADTCPTEAQLTRQNIGCRPYGAAADRLENVWFVCNEDWLPSFDGAVQSLVQVDMNDITSVRRHAPTPTQFSCFNVYGIAVDSWGRVWLGSHACSGVFRFDPMGEWRFLATGEGFREQLDSRLTRRNLTSIFEIMNNLPTLSVNLDSTEVYRNETLKIQVAPSDYENPDQIQVWHAEENDRQVWTCRGRYAQ